MSTKSIIRRRGRSREQGFTLLEMVGVLSIISILASLAVPSLVSRIKQANSAKESKTLETLAETLKSYILKHKFIPDESTWAQSIAGELGVSLNTVTLSTGQQQRIYWVDPALSIAQQTGILPYTQTAAGSSAPPASARILIISSRLLPLPATMSSGIAQSAEEFESIWDADRHEIPEGWPAEWSEHGDDLHFERLNLTPFFHRVVINDITDADQAEISVDGSASFPIPEGGLSSYYFEGTEIALLSDGITASRELIDRDLSMTYERGIWRGQLWEGKVKDATDLAAALDQFRLSRITNQAALSASQQMAIDAYYNYVTLYAVWVRQGANNYSANHPLADDIIDFLVAQNHISIESEDQARADLQARIYPTPLYLSLLDAQSALSELSQNLLSY